MKVNKATILAVLCLAIVLPAGCRSPEVATMENTLSLSSAAFPDGSAIPDKYTCRGEDISPPLAWGEPPADTRSLALIVDDLDTSARFTHWVLFGIPANIRELPEFLSAGSVMPGAREGKNDFGEVGYGGPCPPPGNVHRYRFTLYALDIVLNLEAGVSKGQVLQAMEGHILAQGQLIGTYRR
jgi:Raf kinase inhibitor-like YbhB/YbcL family protein